MRVMLATRRIVAPRVAIASGVAAAGVSDANQSP